MTYMARVREMSAIRQPKVILDKTRIANIKTKLQIRTSELKGKFECKELREIPAATRISLGAFEKYVGEKIKETLNKNWREGMTEKTTLRRYRNYKSARGIIDNL